MANQEPAEGEKSPDGRTNVWLSGRLGKKKRRKWVSSLKGGREEGRNSDSDR